MSLYRNIRRQIILDLARVYITSGKKRAPEGVNVQTTKRGAKYYETDDIKRERPESKLDSFKKPEPVSDIPAHIHSAVQQVISNAKLFDITSVNRNTNNPLGDAIADLIGFHAKPSVVSPENIHAWDLNPGRPVLTLRRGVGRTHAPDYISGKSKCQRGGVFGSGIYTMSCNTTDFDYKKIGKGGKTLESVLQMSHYKALQIAVRDAGRAQNKVNFMKQILPLINQPVLKQQILEYISKSNPDRFRVSSNKVNWSIPIGEAMTQYMETVLKRKLNPIEAGMLESSVAIGIKSASGEWDESGDNYTEHVDTDDPKEYVEQFAHYLEKFDISAYITDALLHPQGAIVSEATQSLAEIERHRTELMKLPYVRSLKRANPELYADVMTGDETVLDKYPKVLVPCVEKAVEGAGTYAFMAKNSDPAGGVVLEMAVDPSAKLGEYEAIRSTPCDVTKFGISPDHPNYQKFQNIVNFDVGLKAMLLGYDGYRVVASLNNGNRTDYMVLLNRAKTIIAQ